MSMAETQALVEVLRGATYWPGALQLLAELPSKLLQGRVGRVSWAHEESFWVPWEVAAFVYFRGFQPLLGEIKRCNS